MTRPGVGDFAWPTGDIYGADSQKKLSLDILYKLYVTQIAGVGANAPAFVPGIKADIKDLEADFIAANKEKRLEWLKGIADLNEFGVKYDADVAAAKARADEAVAKKTAETAAATKAAFESKAAAKSTNKNTSKDTKALSDLADKEKELSTAKAVAEKIRAAPKAPAADSKPLGIKAPPVSVNAILVPVN